MRGLSFLRLGRYLYLGFPQRNLFHDVEDMPGSGVAEWARTLTGDRTVNGSSPAAVKTFRFASELWQFRLPRLASVFRMIH